MAIGIPGKISSYPIATALTGQETLLGDVPTPSNAQQPISTMQFPIGLLAATFAVSGFINPVAFGADPSGAASSSNAATAASAAGLDVYWPQGTFNLATAPSLGLTLQHYAKGTVFTGASAGSMQAFANFGGDQLVQPNSGPTDQSMLRIARYANHTGGSPAQVNTTLMVHNTVSSAVANIEFAGLFVMFNSATGGQNTALFSQGIAVTGNAAGPTWAGVFEVFDATGAVNPPNARLALELDNRANGTDSIGNRLLIDGAMTRPFSGGSYSGAAATFGYGFRIDGGTDSGNTLNSAYSVAGLHVNVAFDCSFATTCATALRMPSGAYILFDALGVNGLAYDGAGLGYYVSGAVVSRLNGAGQNCSLVTAGTALGGTSQYSFVAQDTLAGTGVSGAMQVNLTIKASTAVGIYAGIVFNSPTLGSGATVSTNDAIFVNDSSVGSSRNSGVHLLLNSGTGKYNVYASGTAFNYLGGALGIGTLPVASATITTSYSALSGATQAGVNLADTVSGTTVSGGLTVQQTVAASTAVTNYRGVWARNASLGASATITNQDGIFVDDQTNGGTRNAGINLNVSAGTGKYNIYAASTAQNLFGGDIIIAGGSLAILHANTTMSNGAGANTGTLTNAPVAGNPTKWVPFNDAGTTRYIPSW